MNSSSLLWNWLIAFREVNRDGRNFTTAEMGILFSIATRADPDGANIHRGIRGVCTDTGAKDETVYKALGKARDMKVIERVRHAQRGKNQADSYVLVPPERWCLVHDKSREEPPY